MTKGAARLRPVEAWALAIGATLTMAVSYFDRQTLASLAPKVTAELDISNQRYGWLVSAFSVAYLLGSPVAGRIIDRFGGRRVLLVAVLIWTIIAALHARTMGFVSLFFLRIALGLAESPSFPGAVQTVHRVLPIESRARGMGLLFTGSSIGALIAPVAASAVEARHGWRVAFLVTAVAGLVWVPMWVALTSRKLPREVLDHVAPEPTDSPGETAPRERPALMTVLTHPAVLRAVIVVLATAPLVGFVLNWAAKYLAVTAGIEQKDMGRYLWVAPLLFDIGSIAFGHFASRHLTRHRTTSGMLFMLAAALGSTLPLLIVVKGPYAIMVVAGVALAGVAGLFAMFTADMISHVPREAVSLAGGITAAAQSLAYIIANPLVGLAVDRTGSYTLPILVLSLPVLPAAVVFLRWKLEPTPIQSSRV